MGKKLKNRKKAFDDAVGAAVQLSRVAKQFTDDTVVDYEFGKFGTVVVYLHYAYMEGGLPLSICKSPYRRAVHYAKKVQVEKRVIWDLVEPMPYYTKPPEKLRHKNGSSFELLRKAYNASL